MPLSAVRQIASAQNGVRAFVLQCKRLDFHYCDWAGSSRGMNAFLVNSLPTFAKRHPQIQIHVSPRPHTHPIIRGHYINGREKVICVRNLEKEQVLSKAELLRDASGETLKKVKAGKWVEGDSENVRGVWSGVHAIGRRGGGPLDRISRKG